MLPKSLKGLFRRISMVQGTVTGPALSLPTTYSVHSLGLHHIESAAQTLSYCFTKNEPISSFMGIKLDTCTQLYRELLHRIYREGLTSVLVAPSGLVEGVVLCHDGMEVLEPPAATDLLPDLHTDPGLRNIELLRRARNAKMRLHCARRGLLDKKLLYLSMGAVLPHLRGSRVAPMLLQHTYECAKAQGYEHTFVFCSTKISASLFPPWLESVKDEIDTMEAVDPIRGRIRPLEGANEWYTAKYNKTRLIAGKKPAKDVARYSTLYEGDIDDFLAYSRKLAYCL